MNSRPRTVQLPDGQEVVIRKFVYPDDTQRLWEFLSSLPAELRNYLRFDVTKMDLLEKRLEMLDSENHWLFLAEIGGEIVGEAALDREPYGWTRHVASIRAVVAPEHDQKGIRAILFSEFIALCERVGIERLFTEVQLEQRAQISRLEKKGFVPYVTMPRYAKDLKGRLHDVIVLSNDLHNVWDQLKEHLEEMDIRFPDVHGGS